MKYLTKLDKAKLYLILGQIIFMILGYVTQIILSKVFLSPLEFSQFQFVNFLTNIFNLFFASAIPTLMLTRIPKILESVDKEKALKHFTTHMFRLTLVQIIITSLLVIILLVFNLVPLSIGLFIFLSSIQILAFGLMNITNFYFLALRESFLFFRSYVFYIFIKSIFILLSAYLTRNINIILISIIFAESLQCIINFSILKINPFGSIFKRKKDEESILGKSYDFITANLLMFGITNLSVVLPFVGLRDNYTEYSIFTLIFPWTLAGFYIISSLGNIYIVDFANGSVVTILHTLKKIFIMSLLISLTSLIVGSIFFYLFYIDNFTYAIMFLALSLPSGILISLISTVISMYQGLGRIKELRVFIGILVLSYSVIVLLTQDLKLIIILSTIAYFIAFLYLLILSRTSENY